MWKRMLEPSLVMIALADLLFSVATAHLLVRGFGWRYTDWSGLSARPFDASDSILAYTVLGGVVWPGVGLILWAVVGEPFRDFVHNRRRNRVEKHS